MFRTTANASDGNSKSTAAPPTQLATTAALLVHQGYAYATAYWEGTLPHEIPFKITPAIAA